MKILTLATSNAKIAKGIKKGYFTYGIHLSPSDLSGYNVCPMASKGCREACLNTAGMGAFSNVQNARLSKTRLFFKDTKVFVAQLVKEITSAVKSAEKRSLIPVFRLNLTSDIRWENYGIFEQFPNVQFYDYTKDVNRCLPDSKARKYSNYHLTFSRSESNQSDCEKLSKLGCNIAVVFSSKSLPSNYLGLPVIDGDESDLRFLDPTPCVVGLYAKGKGKRDTSGFVVNV